MGADLGLVEQDRLRRIHPRGDKRCSCFARGAAQFLGILPDGDRVHIDEAIDRLDPLILLLREAFERAEVVAQRQVARG